MDLNLNNNSLGTRSTPPGSRVDAPGGNNNSTPTGFPDGRSSSFRFSFSNIRGLSKNLTSIEHHLFNFKPNLLLLSETQISSDASTDPFLISDYELFSRFRSKGGICAYCHTNTPAARLMDLESPLFDILWLKISLPSQTIFFCLCYAPFSPPTNYPAFFQYLTSCHERLQTSHPHAEILYLGDFNVHHTEWLSSHTTDVGGREAFEFSISNEMEQLIKHPTRVPDRHGDRANILDLLLTSNPNFYSYSVESPLGSSDHCLISVSCSFAQPPPLPHTQRRLWHFDDIMRSDLSSFLSDFPWRDYCFRSGDPNVVAPLVTDVVVARM